MSIQLEGRVRVLEETVKRQEEVIQGLLAVISEAADGAVVVEKAAAPQNGPRQMCPKCRVKPNHFLHVKYCKGPAI